MSAFIYSILYEYLVYVPNFGDEFLTVLFACTQTVITVEMPCLGFSYLHLFVNLTTDYLLFVIEKRFPIVCITMPIY